MGLCISSITLLMTDSRGPIIYSIFILFLFTFIFSRRRKPKFLWTFPLIGVLGPFLMLYVLSLISQTEIGGTLSRSSNDLETGGNRSIIWVSAASDFITFKADHHIFGYGDYGHAAVGASSDYARFFGYTDESSEFMHPHNTYISILLDYGYVGFVLFMIIQFIIVKYINSNWVTNQFISYLLLANLIYFNLLGIGETLFGFYYKNIIYLFFMINIFVFTKVYNSNYNNKINYFKV